MDFAKELNDLIQAVKDGLEDGRINLRDALRILKEAADLIEFLAPIVAGEARRMTPHDNGDIERTGEN